MRWRSPRSMRSHSLADTTRGMTSNGKMRSELPPSPYSVKVMPILSNARSAAACRTNNEPGSSPLMPFTSGSKPGRGTPRAAKVSS